MRAKEVRIVHTTNPQAGSVTLDDVTLVQKHGKPNGFQECNFLDKIMVTENCVTRLLNMRNKPSHQLQRSVVLLGDLVVIVTGENRDVVFESIDPLNDDIDQGPDPGRGADRPVA